MKSKLLTQIQAKYKPGELFVMSDVRVNYMSDAAAKQEVLRLTKAKDLVRYAYGLYFLPGGANDPSFSDAIKIRFLARGDKVYGFYTGDNFLTTVMGHLPDENGTIEIMTNHATSGKKTTYMFGRSFVVRAPYVPIDKYNASLNAFLSYISMTSLRHIKDNYPLLANYIRKEHLSAIDVMDMATKFPNKAASKLLASDLYRSLWKH